MGHDHHFLSRLDRVNDSQVELALALYRDHELVGRLLLAHRHFIPEGAERVAIALDDSGQGPFLIVARNGHFVTCLAKGMKLAAGLALISRVQLDRFAAGAEAFRTLTGSFSDPNYDGLVRLISRAAGSPHLMASEDMRELAAVAPMIDTDLGDHFTETQQALIDRWHLVGHVKGTRGKDGLLLENWWRATWTYGVLAPIVALRDRRDFEWQGPEILRTIGWIGVAQGLLPVAMRAIWAAARLGDLLFGAVRKDIEQGFRIISVVSAVPSLLAAALRCPKLEPQVRDLLSPDRVAPFHAGEASIDELLMILRDAIEVLDAPERREAEFVALGRAQAVERSELGFRSADEVPEEIARCLALGSSQRYFMSDDALSVLFNATPWLARARPEELFLPRRILKLIERPYSAERAMDATGHLRELVASVRRPQPPPRPPGPNEPCSCGSGRKYKKCCGAPKSA